ncbi:NUDIX hydrolase [Haloarcula pelagica]|uniref:NUDIX hydrolase n=1 Tax=Haloarcula pelagica TaxID=3033389 RepID=UPI0024C368F9|nr:NUDIX domain-containing protein [Halomicroarcula sp. YJ-61-S]
MGSDTSTRQGRSVDHGSGGFTVRRGAKALVRTDSSVLLVRERHGDGTPFWTLPGGGVEPGECPETGLRRELREELGCRVYVGAPGAWFPYRHQGRADVVSVYTVFDCLLASGVEPNAGEGVFACRWVDPAAVPATTLPQVRQLCRSLADGE